MLLLIRTGCAEGKVQPGLHQDGFVGSRFLACSFLQILKTAFLVESPAVG